MASRAQGLLESPRLFGLTVFIISIGPLVMCLIVDAFGGVLFVVVVVSECVERVSSGCAAWWHATPHIYVCVYVVRA